MPALLAAICSLRHTVDRNQDTLANDFFTYVHLSRIKLEFNRTRFMHTDMNMFTMLIRDPLYMGYACTALASKRPSGVKDSSSHFCSFQLNPKQIGKA